MPPTERSRIASISWEGDSWKVLKSWPKAMQSIGQGVFELKDSDERTWYRMVYLARVEDTIYVLDCFEKDTAKTERKNLNTARSRLAATHS